MARIAVGLILVALAMASLWMLEGEGLLSLLLDETGRWPALVLAAVVYALLMSLPFVPGLELGWLIIGLFGRPGILTAWGCTVLGLCLGFTWVRLLRDNRYLARLVVSRNQLMAEDPEGMPRARRVIYRCIQWHHRHPYLFILVTLNVPGNWVIGGGGGIAWLSALTPGIRLLYFLATVTVATGVVPMILLLTF